MAYNATTPDSRVQRLIRIAPKIQTQDHLDRIMLSFPENQRSALLEQIKPLLNIRK